MSKITNQELTLLRTQPHSTKLWLSIYQPPTVLAARVNDSGVEKGEYLITYDSLSVGSHTLVQSGMTLWVGSAAGLDDMGKVRVRSATSSVLTVAENDHIDWADNLYLTVVAFYEINAIFPRIIQPDPEELEVVFYKDYDIAYTDQNTVLGSFVVMGPHYAGFLENGSTQVCYSASGTSNMKGDALTYSWFFQGATVTGSSSQNPGNITYTTPGHYTTRLTVSNASGGSDVSYRHVSIYQRPEDGTNVPILLWSLEQLSGSREGGGYNGRVKVRQSISNTILKDGSLVVIFADDSYGATKQSIGGNAAACRASIVFVGYVLDGTIEYNYADSSVEFEIGSPSEIMKISEGFSISVESKTAPEDWFQLLNMNVKRATYHYLRWHSTFLLTNDVIFRGTDQNLQFFDADRESLYDAVKTLISSALVGKPVCDRQGRLYLEVDGYTQGITLETNFTLDPQDWTGQPEVLQRQNYAISFIETGGIAYVGPDLTDFTALLAAAPGDAPAYKGKLNRFQGLALTDQTQLNALVGDIFAYQNSEFPNNTFNLAGNYRNFDIAPQENIRINLAPDQNVRGVNFFGKLFLVSSIDWVYLSREEFLFPVIDFAENTNGFPGDTIEIPDVPDVGGFGNTPPFEFPPFNIPPFDTETSIELYDEDAFLGNISEIDFQGSPVTATLDGDIGIVAIEFDAVVTGNDSIGYTKAYNQVLSGELTFLAPAYNNGFTIDDKHLIADVSGVYMASVNGYFDYLDSLLCANKLLTYGGTISIRHYNSVGTLLNEYIATSSRAYCFESPSTGFDVAIDNAPYFLSRTFSMSAGAYLVLFVTPEESPTVQATFSVFRIT